jgi:hypothetical protein
VSAVCFVSSAVIGTVQCKTTSEQLIWGEVSGRSRNFSLCYYIWISSHFSLNTAEDNRLVIKVRHDLKCHGLHSNCNEHFLFPEIIVEQSVATVKNKAELKYICSSIPMLLLFALVVI